MNSRVGIIGAGLSGLATAFYLRRLRPEADIVVFEANERAGGTMQTHVIDGFHFETGSNGFLTNKPDGLQLVRDCGLAPRLLPSSDATRKRFLFHDRLYPLPDSPPAFLKSSLLSGPQKLRVLAEPLIPAQRTPLDETVREFGNRRLGRGFTDIFLDAMCAGIYGSTPERLSVGAAFPLVVALERDHGGLFRGMLAKRRKDAGPGGVLTSLQGGLQTLTDRLVAATEADWQWSSPVRAIERTPAGYRVVVDRGTSEFGSLAICTPSYVTASLLRNFDAELSASLSNIDYAPIAVVGFGYRSLSHSLDGFGILTTTSARLPILGVLWDSSVFPDRAPPGMKSLRVLIGGRRNPELVAQDDDGLIRTARDGLRVVMALDEKPDVTFVKRWERGIPGYDRGHLALVGRIDAALAKWPGLYLNGNAYRGVAMNDCIRNSRMLAESLAAGAVMGEQT